MLLVILLCFNLLDEFYATIQAIGVRFLHFVPKLVVFHCFVAEL